LLIVAAAGERHQGQFKNDGEKKVHYLAGFAYGAELIRSMIDHKKVLVLAMNGPGVGAGASWFQGTSDLFFAASETWLQVTFSQLGLIPEMGSAVNWAHHIGPHKANDWLMLGGKATVEELHAQGLVNKIFPKEGFHGHVQDYLVEMLRERSGASMMEAKRLQNKATRDARILALFEAVNALAERFVDGEPARRMAAKAQELVGESARGVVVHYRDSVLTCLQIRGRPASRRCRKG
jgi:Delta3-Delta2-enoyl-CoA isomerase